MMKHCVKVVDLCNRLLWIGGLSGLKKDGLFFIS